MSLAKHPHAKFSGWEGPIYPEGVDHLGRAFDLAQFWANQGHLRIVGSQLEGYDPTDLEIITTDGYEWLIGLLFNMPDGIVLVTFPWALDMERKDGCTLDRLPAVYTKGRVTRADFRYIVHGLTRLLSM